MFHFKFVETFVLPLIVLLCCVCVPNTSSAHEPDGAIVYDQAIELRCAADDMRDEIKTHFRGRNTTERCLAPRFRFKLAQPQSHVELGETLATGE